MQNRVVYQRMAVLHESVPEVASEARYRLPSEETLVNSANEQEEQIDHEPKYTRKCGGKCVGGPSGGNRKFYFMSCVNVLMCLCVATIDILNYD